jgi:hypothetical protein
VSSKCFRTRARPSIRRALRRPSGLPNLHLKDHRALAQTGPRKPTHTRSRRDSLDVEPVLLGPAAPRTAVRCRSRRSPAAAAPCVKTADAPTASPRPRERARGPVPLHHGNRPMNCRFSSLSVSASSASEAAPNPRPSPCPDVIACEPTTQSHPSSTESPSTSISPPASRSPRGRRSALSGAVPTFPVAQQTARSPPPRRRPGTSCRPPAPAPTDRVKRRARLAHQSRVERKPHPPDRLSSAIAAPRSLAPSQAHIARHGKAAGQGGRRGAVSATSRCA